MAIASIISLSCTYAVPGGSAVMLGSINLENDALPLMEDKEITPDPTIKVLGRYREISSKVNKQHLC